MTSENLKQQMRENAVRMKFHPVENSRKRECYSIWETKAKPGLFSPSWSLYHSLQEKERKS